MPWRLVSTNLFQVNEGDADIDTSIEVTQGDTLIIHATGQIWAGVVATGLNGPRGWSARDYDNKFPLPGAHPFQLLGKLDGGYFEIGDRRRLDRMGNQGTLFLRINDDVPGNGSGAFQVTVRVYRGD